MAKKEKYRGVENKDYARAMINLRRSSAASPHEDSRSKRKRTASAARRAAIADSTE